MARRLAGLQVALFCALVSVVLVPRAAHASTIALNFDNTTGAGLGNPPFTLGWSFNVLNDIVVTDLGLFDDAQDGLTDRYPIGIWDSAQNLLVSTTLPSGTSAVLDDKFRFEPVTHTPLSAGQTYFIGALFTTGNDGLIFPGTATGLTTSDISFLAAQFAAGGSLAFPGLAAGSDPGYFGPNFKFDESNPVPEPATLLLLGAGLVPMARRAVRRRTSR